MTTPFPHRSADAPATCPVSGLPIHTRPEWTDRRFGGGYRLTSQVIGDRILLNRPSGFAELAGIVDSLRMTDAIVRQAIDASAGYVHIADFAGMRGITREARKYYIRHMERRTSMLGLIYFNASPLFRIMIKLAKRFSIVTFNVLIVKDYPAAIATAMRLIGAERTQPPQVDAPVPAGPAAVSEHDEHGRHILRCDQWRLELDDYRLTAEVIDRRIYHARSSGNLKAHHVDAVSRLRETVHRMAGLPGGFRAIVTGTTDGHTTDRGIRRAYMASLRQWHERFPFDLYVFYGANRFIRTAAMLAIPFLPFKVRVVPDLAAALALADRLTAPAAPGSAALPETAAEDPLHVVHRLLQFLGDIDWERHGMAPPDSVEANHPFRPVFDAITLIKSELDTLFEERSEAERALRESQQRFDEVLRHSRDLLFKRDLRRGTYDYVSDAIQELLGITPEAACRAGFEGMKARVHPDDLPRFLAFQENLVKNGADRDVDHVIEFRLRDSRGAYRWFSQSATIIRDADGTPIFHIGSNRDITHIKALEAERREVAEDLRQARKLEAVSTMAGGVAHNFNNLLMVVLGNLELMQAEVPAGSPLSPRIEAAERAAQRAADLSTLMLTFVGQTKITPRPIDLNRAVSEMADVLRTTVAEKAALRLEPAGDPLWIHADSGKLFQVLSNLVANAVEAAGDQPPEVRLAVGVQHCDGAQLARLAPGDRLPAGRYVSLRVSDNGRGMDQETLEKVFDPFFTTKFTGRGLGMAAVMGILRAHRGGVRVDSRLGGGTAVTVYFPEHEPAPPPPPAPAGEGARRSGGVLIVDDEPLVLDLGKQMLERLGCEVLTAVDGVEALEVFAANRERIQVAILDIEMPRMDGRETLARLRAEGATFPVLVASGFIEAQVREKLGDAAVDGFIQKPFRLDQLKEKLEALFAATG